MGTNIAEVSWERVQENLEIIEFPKGNHSIGNIPE